MLAGSLSLSVLALVSILGVEAISNGPVNDWPKGPVSTAGLVVDDEQTVSLFTAMPKNQAYVLFMLNGDVRKRMHSPQNIHGFMDSAGHRFALVMQGKEQSFTTEIDKMTLKPSGTANCVQVEWQHGMGDETDPFDYFTQYCAGQNPIQLADAAAPRSK